MPSYRWIAPLTFVLTACAGAQPPPLQGPPAPLASEVPEVVEAPPPQRPDGEAWKSTEQVEHPDVGRIWSNRSQAFVTWPELLQELAGSPAVLLGETHDNADHHDMHAAIIVALAADGGQRAVVFEMVGRSRDKDLKRFASRAESDPDALREMLAWDKSGWPDWSLYRPVFAAALASQFPIFGAQIARDSAKRIAGRGLKAVGSFDARLVAEQGLAKPLEPKLRAGLLEVLFDGHCQVMPRHHLGGMLLIQRVRDAHMASRLEKAAKKSKHGVVLIAGNGHVRNDWAVPRYLKRRGYISTSVAFVEVEDEVDSETGNDAPPMTEAEFSALPFDYVVVTPGRERPDPCVELRERL